MGKSFLWVLVISLLCQTGLRAQVADSVDVLDYDICLDLSQVTSCRGEATLSMKLLRPCQTIGLSLIGTVDSVEVAGTAVSNPDLGALPVAGIAVGQVFMVHVWYSPSGYVEGYGFGGLHLSNGLAYNLGVGFDTDPHPIGRAWFPCRDNFHDKATYTLRVKTKAGWTAECGGIRQSVSTDSTGCENSVWRIDQQIPTYLASISQANWNRFQDTITSVYGNYPLTIGYRSGSRGAIIRAFEELDSVVPMFERCFGPYRWGRIGYIATPKGSMEHTNNIALVADFVSSMTEPAQTTIAHELGHAWFGNLITCADEGDMWINEGGASFTSEVAMEAVKGREASDEYYQRYLEKVLRTNHIADGSYLALHGIPHRHTYGSTAYEKGWMVWHSLRGFLGEERFYNALRTLMERCAFGTLDAYQLRDSLSLYSGVDLTDFFNFHVFSSGFVDYHVEMTDVSDEGATVRVRQQAVATSQTLNNNRVPVAIYGYVNERLDSVKRWVEFEGMESSATYEGLPFRPAFCMIDCDYEISDAAIVAGLRLAGYGDPVPLHMAHVKVGSKTMIDVRVEHHMAPAMGDLPGGVIRRAGRYWMLRGNWGVADSVELWFRHVRTGYVNGGYPYLDQGFYFTAASVDSLGLFYRPNSSSPWVLVSRNHTGDANEGWMGGRGLLPGEYTLAVVDFEHLAISHPTPVEVQLFPNPLSQGQPLTVEVDSPEPFTVSIFDAGGRQVWQKEGCRSGEKMNPRLAKGTYFVRIENNFISLQSKLIQL